MLTNIKATVYTRVSQCQGVQYTAWLAVAVGVFAALGLSP